MKLQGMVSCLFVRACPGLFDKDGSRMMGRSALLDGRAMSIRRCNFVSVAWFLEVGI